MCVTLVQALERWDQGGQFVYTPMQDARIFDHFALTPQNCTLGLFLVDLDQPEVRWQGAAAVEEIGRRLHAWIDLYRALPGFQTVGEGLYGLVRDTRYALWGRRDQTYWSCYPWSTKVASPTPT